MLLRLIRSLYLNRLFFYLLALVVVLCTTGFFIDRVFIFGRISLYLLVFITIADIIILYHRAEGIKAWRTMADKLSNGDENMIGITVNNMYTFPVKVSVIDELPVQFQERNFSLKEELPAFAEKQLMYSVRPVKRGEYRFGALNLFTRSVLGLVSRRYIFSQDHVVPVYPSYIQMHRYELLAIHNRLTEAGVKKIRRIGNNFEFEQIREYVSGDDFRVINWKATARRGNPMVNQYQDERSQQVYCLIDKGRMMKMPFEEMTLLDYAINASLVLSNIAIRKSDKAGILSFSDRPPVMLKAQRSSSQMKNIMDLLYRQKTSFLEPDYEALYATVKSRINQRSLLVLFTNFETMDSLLRNIGYLRALARTHLLVTVFFENTELDELLKSKASSTEDIYIKTIAEQFVFEKKQIAAELKRHGIHSILTRPADLTVNTINKYLELKARGLI